MANVLFKRLTNSQLSGEAIEDGKIIYVTDTGRHYIDNGSTRVKLDPLDSALSTTSTNAIQNKAVAGVMLKSLSDISIVTKSGFLTDALATKELDKKVGVWLGAYTITAGETSYTISDSSITTDSTIDVYSNVYGFNPTDITVSDGSITLVFDAQDTDLGVKVRVM